MAKKSSKKDGVTTKSPDDPDTVAKLLDGYRVQTRLASRTWTALAFLSVYVLAAVGGVSQGDFKLPFLEVELTASWFLLASEALLLALTLRWVEAINRTFNTRSLVQPVLDRLDSAGKTSPSHIDAWDAQVLPGTGAVWSLPRSMLGDRKGMLIGIVCCFCYLVLAVLAVLVHDGLPACAVYILRGRAAPSTVVTVLAIVAFLALFGTLCRQMVYIARAVRRMWELATADK